MHRNLIWSSKPVGSSDGNVLCYITWYRLLNTSSYCVDMYQWHAHMHNEVIKRPIKHEANWSIGLETITKCYVLCSAWECWLGALIILGILISAFVYLCDTDWYLHARFFHRWMYYIYMPSWDKQPGLYPTWNIVMSMVWFYTSCEWWFLPALTPAI